MKIYTCYMECSASDKAKMAAKQRIDLLQAKLSKSSWSARIRGLNIELPSRILARGLGIVIIYKGLLGEKSDTQPKETGIGKFKPRKKE